MSTNTFIPLSDVQSLEAHNFDANPGVAVQGALLDVARYGVAQLCNIGPVLSPEELQAMSLWAELHEDDIDGLIRSKTDEINSRVDVFAPTIKTLFGELGANTTTGLSVEQMSLREREPFNRPDWHKDGQASQVIASGLRAIFPLLLPEDATISSFLVSRHILSDNTDRRVATESVQELPISAHLTVPYRPRTAVLMAEGTGGMKVISQNDGIMYGVESPMHAGWCNPANPVTRYMLVVDSLHKKSKRNNSAFKVPLPPERLRLAV